MADTFKTDRINTTTSKNKKIGFGFSDPSGSYPTSEYFYKSSVNRGVTGEDIHTIEVRGGDPNIDIKDLYKKPTSGSNYGDISVRQTKSGHVMVFDDTNGNESILIKHRDGSGFTLQADGTMVMATKKNRVTQVQGTDALLVEGDIKISCQNLEIDATGDLDMRVGGDYNLTVGGEKKETVIGSSREDITGNKGSKVQGSRSETTVKDKTTTVLGNDKNIIKGNVGFTIGGYFDLGATGYSKVTSEQQIAYTAPNIDIVGEQGQISLLRGIYGGDKAFFHGLNYYGRSAKFDKGVTAPTFHGDLNGTAKQAIDANKAATAAVGSASAGGYSMTNTATNTIREGKGPSADSISDIMNSDPRGIKRVSIDVDNTILTKLTKDKITVKKVRAELKDPNRDEDSAYIADLIEQGKLSDSYFQKVPPAIGRVTNGKKALLPYQAIHYTSNMDMISGERNLQRYLPDTLYDPNTIDPRGGVNMITSKTLLAAAIPISTFLAGWEAGAATLGHIGTFEERQKLARQLLLQTEVLKLCRENEGRFKNHRIIVSEGVYKLGNVVPRKGSTVDLRTNGQAITYELYDEQNRNLTDVSYEFAAYLADQLPFFEKIILDYDTIEPNPSSEPWSKVNTQIVVTMPEVDKEYKFIGAPSYTLFTAFNNNLLSGTDLVEVTLDTVKDITFEPTTPHKAGPQYFASDFVGSRFASNIAVKINELHPSIRKKAAGGIQDYIATYKDDLRDINVVEAFRSSARQNDLKRMGINAAAGGFSWHNYGAAIDIAIYVDGVYDDGRSGDEEYTGRLRRSMVKFGLYNGILGDSGHFWPQKFPATPPRSLRSQTISLDDYVKNNL